MVIDVDGGKIKLSDDGTEFGQIFNNSGLHIISKVSDQDMLFLGNDGGSEITALTLDMSDGGVASFAKHVKLVDGAKIYLGTGGDLELFHDGNNGYIKDVGTGILSITSDGTGIDINKGTSEYMGRFIIDGAVELYHNNGKKLETTTTGITVTGVVTETTAKTAIFTGQHDGTTTGDITLGSLGFKPQVLHCFFGIQSTHGTSFGHAGRDAGQMVVSDYEPQANGWEHSTSYFARIAHGQAKFSNLSITSWGADAVVINKNVNNSGADGTCAYKIIVQG